MPSSTNRALHWVFKIGNLASSLHFLQDTLGMHVLRHEEFNLGCEAECNGAYDRPWSKTMIGYGAEADHFVLELTYNYNIRAYQQGNDLPTITIAVPEPIYQRAAGSDYVVAQTDHPLLLCDPNGYRFKLLRARESGDPMRVVSLPISDLAVARAYWVDTLGMRIFAETAHSLLLGYAIDQCKLELVHTGQPINHAEAYGRIAFSTHQFVHEIATLIAAKNYRIHTEPVTLTTPGKADVKVVILLDPDGYEICFVEAAGFADLSQPSAATIDWAYRQAMGDTIPSIPVPDNHS